MGLTPDQVLQGIVSVTERQVTQERRIRAVGTQLQFFFLLEELKSFWGA